MRVCDEVVVRGTGPASQRQLGLIFNDMPSRPLWARSPPSAASSEVPFVVARPRPKFSIAASATKSASTTSHPPPPAVTSARPTWSSHGSARSAVSGTGTAVTRLSAASVKSLLQCPLTKVARRSQGCDMPGGSCCSALCWLPDSISRGSASARLVKSSQCAGQLHGPCLTRFVCSLQELMKDPVVCPDGHTYEVHPRIG